MSSWMFLRIAAMALSFVVLLPHAAFCVSNEKAALSAYFDALAKRDAKQLAFLLAPDEYHYYKDAKLHILSRANELNSLNRLANDLPGRRFALPDLFSQDREDWECFQVVLSVIFEDCPKIPTDSFFRGVYLELDETLTVTSIQLAARYAGSSWRLVPRKRTSSPSVI